MTTRVTIGVKHGKETHDVDVDLDESGATFKARLCSLTNVPIERIKVTGLGADDRSRTTRTCERRASRRWRDEGRNC
jgi:ubiquitin carboxyl-terminal hydrolase 14